MSKNTISNKALIVVCFKDHMINHKNGNYKQLSDVSSNINNKLFRKSTLIVVLLVAILTISIFAFPLSTAKVYAQSPYSSGYDHGCDDANIANPYDRYINQPGKGPSYHTGSFMNGYYEGFDSCFYSNTITTPYPPQSSFPAPYTSSPPPNDFFTPYNPSPSYDDGGCGPNCNSAPPSAKFMPGDPG